MQATRLLRRAALAAALITTACGAVSGVAHAAPFTQEVTICIAADCNQVPLPDGLPNITSLLTSSAEAACGAIGYQALVDQSPTAYAALCGSELGLFLVPASAAVAGNGAVTYSYHSSSATCYTDRFSLLAAVARGTAQVAAEINSGTC